MKIRFKNLCLYGVIILLMLSCGGSDESSKTSVKYMVTSTATIITSVKYRAANGEMKEAVGDNAIIEWSRSINVDEPFNARLEVTVMNSEPNLTDYDLAIYIDGELVDYDLQQAPPNATHTSVLEYDLN